MDIDDVLRSTGEFGWLQKRVLCVYCLLKVYLGTHLVQNVFVGSIPKVHCKDEGIADGCDSRCKETEIVSDFYSVASEWNLVCEKETSARSVQAIVMAGVMVGSFVFGQLSDAYGRRLVLLGTTTCSVVFALASAYASSFEAYTTLRFFTAFFLGGKVVAGFVLMSELVGPAKRGLVGTAPAAFFALGICCLSGLAYSTKNWRDVSLWTGLFGAAVLPLAFWTFCESPRWLLRAGKVDACCDLLKSIAAQNGHSLGPFQLKQPDSVIHIKGQHSVLDLFRHHRLRKLMLLQLYAWFVNSTVYYGLTMAAGSIGSSMYSNVALSGLVELPSNFLCLRLMNHPRLGRLRTLYWSMLGSGFACICVYLLPTDLGASNVTYLALVGKVFITISFAIVHVQSSELFPTGLRNSSLGVLSVANRLGGIASPLVLNLERTQHSLQFLVFGVLAMTSGLLNGFLPETLNKPLPDTAEDLFHK